MAFIHSINRRNKHIDTDHRQGKLSNQLVSLRTKNHA